MQKVTEPATSNKRHTTDAKPLLGCFATSGHTEFRLFCPRAKSVEVELFDSWEQNEGKRYALNRNGNDIWQITIRGDYRGKLYGYHIKPPEDKPCLDCPDGELTIADPYSRMVVTKNHHLQIPKSVITEPDPFDWEGDDFVSPEDLRDLIIYETHLKDLTAHPSSGSHHPGTYKGFTDPNGRGGINHLKKMGVNAVELLPIQKFAYFEPEHNEPVGDGVVNTWNAYGRNYWGYMTSFFFIPEPIYATDGTTKPNAIIGQSPKAAHELKEMVKALHKEGISVILDVVFNHVSQYDLNPFKMIDKEYYFRLDEKGRYKSESGCGNDFRTESPMARRLIIDSVLFWMKEFHIDGFRFDLANLIDKVTLQQLRTEAEAVNPKVILIGEPWGGGYDPSGFSKINWASWNDQIRNGVKGSDPLKDCGFIFGHWQWETSREGLENFLSGTLNGFNNGRYNTSAHAVNYIESHDGYTLGDFIRIGLDNEKASRKIERDELVKLRPNELKLNKLAALYLFASQGTCMMHAGQEWARTKVIQPEEGVNDVHAGRIDHNSYEKDNLTNYLNFGDISSNHDLVQYYRALIEIRKTSPALRKAVPEDLQFWNYSDSLHITLTINGETVGDPYNYIVSLNGNPFAVHSIQLPAGVWEIVASGSMASANGFDIAAEELKIEPSSGYILRKLRSKD